MGRAGPRPHPHTCAYCGRVHQVSNWNWRWIMPDGSKAIEYREGNSLYWKPREAFRVSTHELACRRINGHNGKARGEK